MAQSFAWVVALAGLLSACDPMPDRDAGEDVLLADAPGGGASAHLDIPREPLELSDVTLRSFTLNVSSVRLVSDRGPDFDPSLEAVGPIDLGSTRTLVFDSIPPASYSAVVFSLADAAIQLDIEATDATLGDVHLSYASRVEWMARCSAGVPVRVGETLRLAIDLELGSAWEELRDSALPPPSGGVITIDEVTAPAVIAQFVRDVGEHLNAECNLE